MMTLEEFEDVCKKNGMVELSREDGEIVRYVMKGADGRKMFTVAYSDTEDGYAYIEFDMDGFHRSLGDYITDSRRDDWATEEWMSGEIEKAKEAYVESEGKRENRELNLYDLCRLLAHLNYTVNWRKLKEYSAVLSGVNAEDLYKAITGKEV